MNELEERVKVLENQVRQILLEKKEEEQLVRFERVVRFNIRCRLYDESQYGTLMLSAERLIKDYKDESPIDEELTMEDLIRMIGRPDGSGKFKIFDSWDPGFEGFE